MFCFSLAKRPLFGFLAAFGCAALPRSTGRWRRFMMALTFLADRVLRELAGSAAAASWSTL
jgi:hypothetical protein